MLQVVSLMWILIVGQKNPIRYKAVAWLLALQLSEFYPMPISRDQYTKSQP